MGMKAILSTLPYKIKEDAEKEAYRHYITHTAKITTENTAKIVGMLGGGKVEAAYVSISYSDIINPNAPKKVDIGGAREKICSKLR